MLGRKKEVVYDAAANAHQYIEKPTKVVVIKRNRLVGLLRQLVGLAKYDHRVEQVQRIHSPSCTRCMLEKRRKERRKKNGR